MKSDNWGVNLVPGWTGVMGVTIFFALSGHLMAQAMQRQEASTFLLHRIARIYPAFFLTVILFFLSLHFSPISLPWDLKALSLMPAAGAGYPLGVEWTLVFELAFYVFVFLLMAFKKQGQARDILIFWLGLILVHNLIWPDDPTKNLYNPLALPFVGVTVGFAAGMLLQLTPARMLHPVIAAVIGVDLWLLGGSVMGLTGGRWGMGFGAALFVTSLAQFRGWQLVFGDTPLGRLGGRLGDYSYALYLCHVPVIRTLYAVASAAISAPILLFGAIVLPLLTCIALGMIDVRMYKFLKTRIDDAARNTRYAIASIFLTGFFGLSIYASFFLPTP